MKKKISKYIGILLFGVLSIAASFFIKGEEFKSATGVLIGIGAGLIGLSLNSVFLLLFEQNNPEAFVQKEIETKDERNTMIRNRAKAKAADIIQWFIMGIAYITILIKAPVWATVAVIFVFVLYNALCVYFMSKYQKTM